MKAWVAGRDIDQDRVQLAQKQFDFYSEQLKIQNPYSSEYDTLVVSRARNYLSQFSGGERAYTGLCWQRRIRPIRRSTSTRSSRVSAEVVVDRTGSEARLYQSRLGLYANALQNLPKYFSGEQWVLGQESASSKHELSQAERNITYCYFVQLKKDVAEAAEFQLCSGQSSGKDRAALHPRPDRTEYARHEQRGNVQSLWPVG